MSTEITQLEQELVFAKEIEARPETIKSLEDRLQFAHSKQAEEEKYKDIEHIKRWTNHYLLKRYDEATKLGNQLFKKGNPKEFETILNEIEQIESEGLKRQLYPFIPLDDFEYKIIWTLGQLTITEGFVASKRVGQELDYPTDKIKSILEMLYSNGQILRYSDETDSWAISVATRERLGITKTVRKEGG